MKTWEQLRAENEHAKMLLSLHVKHNFSLKDKGRPAEALYEVRYNKERLTEDHPDKGEILEDFCQLYWGCSFDELMKWWDEYIG